MVSIGDSSDWKSLIFKLKCTFLAVIKVFSLYVYMKTSFNILMVLASSGCFSIDASALGSASCFIMGEGMR